METVHTVTQAAAALELTLILRQVDLLKQVGLYLNKISLKLHKLTFIQEHK